MRGYDHPLPISDQERSNSEQAEREREQIVNDVYPFSRPPQNIIDGTFLVVDPELQLSSGEHGLHIASSLSLVHQRKDNLVLVPGIALGKAGHPLFDVKFAALRGMARTTAFGREYAVWLGAARDETWRHGAYTPARATEYLQLTREIKELYRDVIDRGSIDEAALLPRMGHLVRGEWFRYYTQKLPDALKHGDETALQEVADLFPDFEATVADIEANYNHLSSEDKLLVENAFRLVYEVRMEGPSLYVYNAEGLDLDKAPDEVIRDPREIAAEPRGIHADRISAVWLPDEIDRSVADEAIRRLRTKGIAPDKIKFDSKRPVQKSYNDCDGRYGRFTTRDLADAVATGRMVHIYRAVHH